MLTEPSLALSLVGGFISHLAFKWIEPRKFKTWVALLVGIPCLLCTFSINEPRQTWHFLDVLVLVQALAIHFLTLLTSLVLYRLSPIHPLASYPGPILARVSNLWIVSQTMTGKRHLLMKSLHETYGPHVRIGPNLLSIADVDAVRKCLGSPGMPRDGGYRTFHSDDIPPDIFSALSTPVADPFKEHAEKRSIWNQGFSAIALEEYNIYMFNRSTQLLDRLTEVSKKGTVDLKAWLSYFSFDVMGGLVFGGGFTMLRDGADRLGYRNLVRNSFRTGSWLVYFHWTRNYLSSLPSSASEGPLKVRQFTADCVHTRLQKPPSQDLLHYLAQEDDSSASPSRESLVSDALIAILAGSDTTSIVLSNIFHLLLAHRQVFEKLREELNVRFEPSQEPMDPHQLGQLPYLNACINEALRLFPPNTSQISRTPTPGSGGCVVAGCFVPEGTTIYLPAFVLGRDSRYFSPFPDDFWPDRWLGNTSGKHLVLNRDAFIPFSHGPAGCVGKHLAYRELRLVVARMARKFDMEFEDGYTWMDRLDSVQDHLTLSCGTVPAKLKLRDRIPEGST